MFLSLLADRKANNEWLQMFLSESFLLSHLFRPGEQEQIT
jgi:hypothetical protein